MLRIVTILIFLSLTFSGHSQRVGVVLSGGGATGFAHIGVLKALEENNIPIDYITGTSAGALIGAMYASGYTPEEIDSIAHSDSFKDMVLGEVDDKYVYYYKQPYRNASWTSIKFFKDSVLQTSLPTNLISSTMIDFELMERFSGAAAAANYNFDSLFIPFRCVASDIQEKKPVVFGDGHLNQSVRASMSFPFYLPPISVNGKVLFDGGLYNNFPADVMEAEFDPDVILGSNVSYNAPPPSEENIFTQVTNMIVKPTDYSLPSGRGLIIEPKTGEIGTFDFDRIDEAIEAGYKATITHLDSIRLIINRRQNINSLDSKREVFRSKWPELIFDTLTIDGLTANQENYVKRVISRKRERSTLEEIKPAYFHIAMDDKIKFIFPTAIYNEKTGAYRMHLDMRKERDIQFDFGGVFSSRPINTGFIGFRYHLLGKVSALAEANSYFGKFYGSVFTRIRLDVPGRFPFTIEPSFTLNRWDYFRSAATFFEDVKPSFIVRNEDFATLRFITPAGNRSKISIDGRYADLDLRYYQTEDFLSVDTADITQFYPSSVGMQYEFNTLNRKQYANQGTYLSLRVRGMQGKEVTMPGSTAANRDTTNRSHAWVYAQLKYERYFMQRTKVRIGVYGEATWTSQKFFQNYTATILATPAFQPIPESKTLFIRDHRAHQYLAGGMKWSYSFNNNLDLRLEGYVFQPVVRILKDFDLKPYYSEEFDNRYFIGSAALVYNTFLGPVSLSFNYYDAQPEPFSLLFSFGYVLFNERALE